MIKSVSWSLVLIFSCLYPLGQEKVISKVVTVDEFKLLIDEKSDLQLVDVRTKREFDLGHLPKSILIDFYKSNFRAELQKLDKTKPIAVYCAIGVRSNGTLRILKQLGFTEVYDLSGGILAWQKKELPIVK